MDAFGPNDQQHLILFLNNKLPLWASKAHPHNGFPYAHHASVSLKITDTFLNVPIQHTKPYSPPSNLT